MLGGVGKACRLKTFISTDWFFSVGSIFIGGLAKLKLDRRMRKRVFKTIHKISEFIECFVRFRKNCVIIIIFLLVFLPSQTNEVNFAGKSLARASTTQFNTHTLTHIHSTWSMHCN